MIYRAIGIMSGSALEGLHIAFVEFQEISGKWNYEIKNTDCYAYSEEWINKLKDAPSLSASDYQLLHTSFGELIGESVNKFIDAHGLQYKIQLLASHGHTIFHLPTKKMIAQLGNGASIAAVTGINVVSDLRAMDMALGGRGAPIFAIGEKLLFSENQFFLNIGGIASLSYNHPAAQISFDVCPANKVLNLLAQKAGKPFDEGGQLAAEGKPDSRTLEILNELEYYQLPYPKSLSNDFCSDVVYPLAKKAGHNLNDALRTMVDHIVFQVEQAVEKLLKENPLNQGIIVADISNPSHRLLVTGGGAKNIFLVEKLRSSLEQLGVQVVVPDKNLMEYKEAVVMALLGILRWREENNTLSAVTGASRDSIGGAVWIGLEA